MLALGVERTIEKSYKYCHSYVDFEKLINVLLKCKWQCEWDEAVNNKLYEIHYQLGLWPEVYRIMRHEENVLVRKRIGHSHLTLTLIKGYPPKCTACDCLLTFKYVYLIVLILINSEKDILI